MKLTDMRGVEIKVGDVVAYGKSNRDSPISIGVVNKLAPSNANFWREMDEEDKWNISIIPIIQPGGWWCKSSKSIIPSYNRERIVVLPKEYQEKVDE